MDINENLLQINTFVGGMNTDTSDSLLDPKLYRFARNLRITTNTDNNSGELHLIEGTTLHKDIFDDFDYEFDEIFASTNIREYGIILVRTKSKFYDEVSIYGDLEKIEVNFNKPVPCSIGINCWVDIIEPGGKLNRVLAKSIVDDLKYVGPYLIFKIGDLDTSGEILGYSISSITINGTYAYKFTDLSGEEYIISGTNVGKYEWGIIRFTNLPSSAKLIFGPCTEPIWENLTDKPSLVTRFESNDNIKLYIADGIHLIMYLNIAPKADKNRYKIEDLQGHTNTALPPLDVKISTSSGNLKPAKVQYCYRLYSENGAATKIAALSKILSLYKDDKSGYANTEKSGRAVDITLPDDTYTDLDKIQIYRITYVQTGQPPEVYMIKDQTYNRGQTIVDSGISDMYSVSISEFLSYSSIGLIPKTIESKNDYLFAGNLKYKQSNVNEIFKDVDTRSFSSGMYIMDSDGKRHNIFEDVRHDVFPELDAELHHDLFDYINNPVNNTNKWMAEYWRSDSNTFGGHGEYFDWEYAYISDTISLDYQTSRKDGMQVSGLRPEEIYRFGVILYDKDGQASSVKWIADIMIPDPVSPDFQLNDPPTRVNIIEEENDKFNTTYSVLNLTVKFKLKQPIPNCSRYEIVRCLRTILDKFTITQGLIGYPLIDRHSKLYPSGFLTTNYIDYENYGSHIKQDFLLFTSPEYVYLEDDVKNLISPNVGNIYIHPVVHCNVSVKEIHTTNDLDLVRINNNKNLNDVKSLYLQNYGNTLRWSGNVGDYNMGSTTKGPIYFYNYIQPKNIIKPTDLYNPAKEKSEKIESVNYVKVPEYNTFSSGETIRYQDDITVISNYQYVGWSFPQFSYGLTSNDSLYKLLKGDASYENKIYPIGTTGKCIIFKLEEEWVNTSTQSPLSITVADVRKYTVPYGGYNKESIENSIYYSYGNDYDATDLSDHIFYGGDCYYKMFLYPALHAWYDLTFYNCMRMSTVYNVPIISDIDLQGRFGYNFNPTGSNSYFLQDTACSFDDYTQDKDLYMYNTAYNSHPDIIAFTTEQELNYDDGNYDTRIHYSELKTNGEAIDNWLLFKAMNFLDVDSRYGEITNLRLFKDKLVFWQTDSTGLLSVNERVLLKDADDTQVVLGTGSVLERYDYFTTLYGMKPNTQVDTQSDTSLYWWDGYRKEILQYTDKYAVTPLTTLKLVRNYINDHKESNKPTIFYDNDNKEVVCNCVNNESIVYSEQIQQFSSVYDFAINCSVTLNDGLHVCDNTNLYYYNRTDNNESQLFGKDVHPYLQYVVNKQNVYNKTFDIQTFGGRFYGGDDLERLLFKFKTPLKQEGRAIGQDITNREYDFRLTIPRAGIQSEGGWLVSDFGDRLRGKTMQCELLSTNNSTDFSLQYIITKFRMSWS